MAKSLDLGDPISPKATVVKQSSNTKKKEAGVLVDLNFKVSPEFKREFKLWAAAHDSTQKKVLEDAFRMLKDSHI